MQASVIMQHFDELERKCSLRLNGKARWNAHSGRSPNMPLRL